MRSRPDLAEMNRQRATHGHTRNAGYSSEYTTWNAMRRRCSPNAKPHDLPRYYGRGIRVCERWGSFENFIADMGLKPSPKHSIERIDPDGNYEPGNCRWASMTEQSRNRRTNVFVEHDGLRLTIAEWSERTGIPRKTLEHRIRNGWAAKEALTMQVHKGNRWWR